MKQAGLGRGKAAEEVKERRGTRLKKLHAELDEWKKRRVLDHWCGNPAVAAKPTGEWRGDETVAENARRVLPAACLALLAAGDRAVCMPFTPEVLHEFRLNVKDLRYSAELLSPGLCAGATGSIELLSDLQRKLGQVNDCVIALDLIHGFSSAEDKLESQLKAKLELLADYWKNTFSPAWRTNYQTMWMEAVIAPGHTRVQKGAAVSKVSSHRRRKLAAAG